MPLIRIEYDNKKVSESEALSISEAAQAIVSKVTGIEDVFVYANSALIKVKIAPVEIFVEMSAHKISDVDSLTQEINIRFPEDKPSTYYS